jgi:hypothetical protein
MNQTRVMAQLVNIRAAPRGGAKTRGAASALPFAIVRDAVSCGDRHVLAAATAAIGFRALLPFWLGRCTGCGTAYRNMCVSNISKSNPIQRQ